MSVKTNNHSDHATVRLYQFHQKAISWCKQCQSWIKSHNVKITTVPDLLLSAHWNYTNAVTSFTECCICDLLCVVFSVKDSTEITLKSVQRERGGIFQFYFDESQIYTSNFSCQVGKCWPSFFTQQSEHLNSNAQPAKPRPAKLRMTGIPHHA